MIPDTTQLVSCVMVTQASRVELAKRAVRCFSEQMYPARELIVVYDEDFDAKTVFKAPLGGPRIFPVKAPPGMSLGDLRNYGIARAGGAYIAQWDDDDWHHPERLQAQLEALKQAQDADGCCLSRWTLAWPARDLFTYSYERLWEGSIVGHRAKMGIYPAVDKGEDTAQLEGLNITGLDRPDLYVYVVHGNNVWNTEHFESMFSASEVAHNQLTSEQIATLKARLG